MRDLVRRFRPLHLVLGARHVREGAVHGRFSASHVVRHFRDFQHRQFLPLLDPVADIDADALDITGNLRHQVDFLEGSKLSRERQPVRQIRYARLGHGDREGVRSLVGARLHGIGLGAGPGRERTQGDQ
jgi:hypothetical protein